MHSLSNTLFFIVAIIVFNNCKSDKETAFDYYSNLEINKAEDIIINKIELDTIFIQHIPDNSFVGFVRIYNDTIYYIDQQTSKVLLINPDGGLISFKLGQGKGPQEIDAYFIQDYIQTPYGDHFFLCSDYFRYLYDNTLTIISKKFLDWKEEHSREEMLMNYRADMPGLYSLSFEEGFKGRWLDGYIYYEIHAEHPEFNMINSDYYYDESRIIAKVNYKDGVVEDILGRRSLFYDNYKFIGHLSFLSFDTDGDKHFFLTFQADSLIYLCDKDLRPLKAFGIKGKNMNTRYGESNSFGSAAEIYIRDRKKCGYYSGLEYIEKRDLLFRSYTRGDHTDYDGLQIYHNMVLIADVDVPKGFKVEGYIEPYFYSSAFIDIENEIIKLYRFTLDY